MATVAGSCALAEHLHVSPLLAMVVAGLTVGNQGRTHAMSGTTRQNMDLFWELLDEIFNAVLFVLIGFEVLEISFSLHLIFNALLVSVVIFLVRLLSAGIPANAFRERLGLPPGAWQVLTWGGLRGGTSVALALSLPAGSERNLIVSLTYVIVAVSILGQGLSIGAVIRRAVDCDETLTKSDKKSRPVISTTLTGLPSKNRKIIYDSA